MATNFELRVYRNEYNEDFLKQIECGRIEGLTAIDGNETVVLVQGEYSELEKLMSLCFVFDPEMIQDVFPSYRTVAEIDEMIDAESEKAFLEIQQHLCNMINAARDTNYKVRDNARFNALYEAWEIINTMYANRF